MAGELRHRGPDGTGLYTDRHFGMINTRLAIIDLAAGDQPLSDETGRYWVMQNGEIFNYPELQDELRSLGHRVATNSDTEVLAHAYEHEAGATSAHSRPDPPRVDTTRTQAPGGSLLCSLV